MLEMIRLGMNGGKKYMNEIYGHAKSLIKIAKVA